MKTSKYFITLIILLSLSVAQMFAQSLVHPQVVSHESCAGKDGALRVVIDAPLNAETNVTWEGPSVNEASAHSHDLSGLEHGTYTLKVFANDCPTTPIFTQVLTIEQEDCNPHAHISVNVNPVPCGNTPTAHLTASASGGVPPYTFSWTELDVSSSGLYTVTVTDSLGRTDDAGTYVYLNRIECSKDPNEIEGPSQYDDSLHYVALNREMRYRIFFENDPVFATAPASMVRVTYPFPQQQDLSSFRLSSFGFGSFVFAVPDNTTTYSQRLDLSDSLGVWVDVTAGLDVRNNQAFWIFQSIDPATGFEPANSQLGFLLINDTMGHGEGFVDFTIMPKQSLHSGDTVSADATIVFDDNDPIPTNVWRNIFDVEAPTSWMHIAMASANDASCTITLSAADEANGSGVASVELLVSENNAPFYSHSSHRPDSAFVFNMAEGVRYRFASRAIDNVGNQERTNLNNDTVIDRNVAPTDILLSADFFYENTASGTRVGEFATVDNDVNLPFVYELVSGEGSDDNDLFAIQGNSLVTDYDFRCLGRYQFMVRVRTTDISGLYFEKSFPINMVQQQFAKKYSYGQYICQGGSYVFNGRTFVGDTVVTDTIRSFLGCDSIVSLRLVVNPNHLIESSDMVCGDSSYIWQGHPNALIPTAYGVHLVVDSLRTRFGCDSIHRLSLSMWPTSSNLVEHEQCDAFSWHGNMLTLSGFYSDTLVNRYGCDSVTSLSLTIHSSSSVTLPVQACDSYAWLGNSYTASGLYYDTLRTIHGCDSILCLSLDIWPSEAETLPVSVCDNYVWRGQSITTSATLVDTLLTVHQCDSIVFVLLTVNHSSNGDEFITACDSYTWQGTTYSASSSNATYTTVNMAGCDSTITLHLTLYNGTSHTDDVAACDGYTWRGQTFLSSGIYADTLATIHGCDSVISLNLAIWPSVVENFAVSACDSYTWAGNTYTASALITDTLLTAHQCDSIVTIMLSVNNSSSAVEQLWACDSYTWHGTTFTASNNVATYTATNATGCDSVITLNLTIAHSSAGVDNVTACDSYTWHGTTYTVSNNVDTYTTSNAAGCDSVTTLNLTINNSTIHTDSAVACDNYTWHDRTLNESGLYADTLVSVWGCDSVLALQLSINPSVSESLNAEACDLWEWNGNQYTTSGLIEDMFINQYGCDSSVTYHLTIYHSVTEHIQITAVDHYEWNGTSYTESGTYTWTGTTVDGCDSTVVLDLTITTGIGVDEVISGNYTMQIYPNPAASSTVVSIAGVEGLVTITIVDNAGRIVASDQIVCSADCFKELDVANLATGVYYVRVSAQGFNQVRKLVVK